MLSVFSNRYESTDHGTFSTWNVPELGFSSFCLELPWRQNQNSISCIPAGTYWVKIRYSQKYGLIFHVTDVHGRSYILIHPGNYAGDVSKGFLTHSKGCLLLGKQRGLIGKQKAVLNSRITVRKFMSLLENNEFKLIITETYKKQPS
ncbi:MAG: DUF5675 family protein [Salinivirgaceae bacterium]